MNKDPGSERARPAVKSALAGGGFLRQLSEEGKSIRRSQAGEPEEVLRKTLRSLTLSISSDSFGAARVDRSIRLELGLVRQSCQLGSAHAMLGQEAVELIETALEGLAEPPRRIDLRLSQSNFPRGVIRRVKARSYEPKTRPNSEREVKGQTPSQLFVDAGGTVAAFDKAG